MSEGLKGLIVIVCLVGIVATIVMGVINSEPICDTRYIVYDVEGNVVLQELAKYTYSLQGGTLTIYLCSGESKSIQLGEGWTLERIGEKDD